MKKLVMMIGAAAFAVGEVAASAYDNIWMHLHHGGLHSDKDLLFVSNAIVRASKAGIKGIMWPDELQPSGLLGPVMISFEETGGI